MDRGFFALAFLVLGPGAAWSQGHFKASAPPIDPIPGDARAYKRYHPTVTPFPGIHQQDQLGSGLAVLGDLDGNGFEDLAIGAAADHKRGECWRGAVWIQFMRSGGLSLSQLKIAPGEGGFTGELEADDEFGSEVAAIGDLDGDGVEDVAVSAPGDDELLPGLGTGAVWLLFLNSDGTVKRHTKLVPPILLDARQPQGFEIRVRRFGSGLAGLGDLDGDGSYELAVGARHGADAREDAGCVWILSLTSAGVMVNSTKLSVLSGLTAAELDSKDLFGFTLARASDMDGNGVVDLLVGAPGDDDGSSEAGALWRFSLAPDRSIVSRRKLSQTTVAGLTLSFNTRFGESAAEIGDLDADGIVDLAVGAPGPSSGWLWILFLNPDASVKGLFRTTSPLTSDYPDLDLGRGWPSSVAALGDTDGNGIPELMAAAPGNAYTPIYGRVWRLNLRRDGSFSNPREFGLVNWTTPTYVTNQTGSGLGGCVLGLGDLDGNGGQEVAVGQSGDNALWILHLDDGRNVERVQKWSWATGFPAGLRRGDIFGASVAWLGDVDGNGFDDLAVGAPGDEDGNTGGGGSGQLLYGAVWIFFLGDGGSVVDVQKISQEEGNLVTTLTQETEFGASLASLGDLDQDGVPDLAVGAPGRSGPACGSVFILFLNSDGTVKQEQRFFSLNDLNQFQRFGCALAHLGGRRLAIGEIIPSPGRVYVAELGPGGLPSSFFEIAPGSGGFTGTLGPNERLGTSLARVGDLDQDGVDDLAVGSPGRDLGTPLASGAVWLLFLDASGHVRKHLTLDPLHPEIDQQIEQFGTAVGACGDVDGDGATDLLVGAEGDMNFPVRCVPSGGGFGILRLQAALSRKL